ncbi:MAG: hypothetical protein ABEK36_06330, partial [Candidatus Aenigmatarchaeota archaeon]
NDSLPKMIGKYSSSRIKIGNPKNNCEVMSKSIVQLSKTVDNDLENYGKENSNDLQTGFAN